MSHSHRTPPQLLVALLQLSQFLLNVGDQAVAIAQSVELGLQALLYLQPLLLQVGRHSGDVRVLLHGLLHLVVGGGLVDVRELCFLVALVFIQGLYVCVSVHVCVYVCPHMCVV